MATGIGSLPYKDVPFACDKILSHFKHIPFWPQLSKRSFKENMYVQFSEKLPGVVVDEEARKIYVNTSGELETQLVEFYEHYLNKDLEYFAISSDYAQGLAHFLKEVNLSDYPEINFVKGHIIGPVSFGLSVTDEKNKAIFYNAELSDAALKLLTMKVLWQVSELKKKVKDSRIIIFIDEPYLTSIGSSYIVIDASSVINKLNEIINALKEYDVICGIHCCGNTDWSILAKTNADIISFDAYNYSESLSLYPEEIKAFLNRGGMLAWGVVPSSEEVLSLDLDKIKISLKERMSLLEKKGISQKSLLKSSLITPSCGLGTLSEELADRVIELTVKLSEEMTEDINE